MISTTSIWLGSRIGWENVTSEAFIRRETGATQRACGDVSRIGSSGNLLTPRLFI